MGPQFTEGFMQTFERIRSIIINECLLVDIDFEIIDKACRFAEYEFKQSKSFSYCVYSGVAVAIKCQHQKNLLRGS